MKILLGRRQWTETEEHGNWEQKGAADCRGQPAKLPRKTSQLTPTRQGNPTATACAELPSSSEKGKEKR